MKRILLASASIVAFAGAAAAEVSFGGSANLGWNDDIEDGFYWEADMGVTFTQALNNGVTAGATFNLNIAENDRGDVVEAGDYLLSLTSDMGSLFFGNIDPVADDIWDGVDGSDVPGFNDKDTHFDPPVNFDAILRGEIMFGGVNGYLSYGIDQDGDGIGEEIDAMQLAATGSFGQFGFIVAYQEEFGPTPQIFAIAGTTSFAGADIKVAYETADNAAETDSIGVSVAYPVGPVTVGGYYTINNEAADIDNNAYGISADYASGPISATVFYDAAEDDDGEFGIEGSYDVGNGIMAYAGYIADLTTDGAQYYVAGTYDLGGGASLLVSYAENEDNANDDEIGDPEYLSGTTVEVTFEF